MKLQDYTRLLWKYLEHRPRHCKALTVKRAMKFLVSTPVYCISNLLSFNCSFLVLQCILRLSCICVGKWVVPLLSLKEKNVGIGEMGKLSYFLDWDICFWHVILSLTLAGKWWMRERHGGQTMRTVERSQELSTVVSSCLDCYKGNRFI